MDDRLLADLLTVFTEDVNAGRNLPLEHYLSQATGSKSELTSLFGLIRDLRTVLAPIQAQTDFKRSLRHELENGHQRRRGTVSTFSTQFVQEMWEMRRPWVIGAALGSAVSVLGVAYVLHQRSVKPHEAPLPPSLG